ncbi:MAG: hypothetical protein HY303_20710 [Candidatus Wallbacteria bacterium]|nr:hypothetical protein [Candidatus Wallbacteria bacterium]
MRLSKQFTRVGRAGILTIGLAAGCLAGPSFAQDGEEASQVHGYNFMSTPELMVVLRAADKDAYAASQAFRALSLAADPAAVEPLAALLDDKGFARHARSVIRTLGNIGDPKAAHLVAKFIDSKEKSTASAARGALSEILGPDGQTSFLKALEALAVLKTGHCDQLRREPPAEKLAAALNGAAPEVCAAVARFVTLFCPDHETNPIPGVPPLPETLARKLVFQALGKDSGTAVAQLASLEEAGVAGLGEVLSRAPSREARLAAARSLATRPWQQRMANRGQVRQAPDYVLARLRALLAGLQDSDSAVRAEAVSGARTLIAAEKVELMMVPGLQRRRYLKGLQEIVVPLDRVDSAKATGTGRDPGQ